MVTDLLSIFFLLIIGVVSIPIIIYSIGYMKEYKEDYSVTYGFMLTIIFILAMIGVIISNNGVTFMVFWELMSVSSFFLVIYEYKKKDKIKSGVMYFIMTHISGLLLMIMFAFINKASGSLDFNKIYEASKIFSSHDKSIIFIFALLGFGAKAGLLPLHAWLPKAHPAAPSNVSALMSGLMLKVAIYGFIRVEFMFLGKMPLNYGIVVLIIGTASAVFAIFNAILKIDIKRLLAYSSVENIGIIFACLGLSMILMSFDLTALSLFALSAALLHVLNHAVFKSLLFASAGSVLYATGTKNMNELGGLYSKMKFATVCAFIGTAAISSIPPLNGFVSEIFILTSFIKAAGSINSMRIVAIIITCGIIISFTGGGAIYAAIKSFGITYLGKTRSEKVKHVHKIPATMNVGMGILAFFAMALGIFSNVIIEYICIVSSSVIKVNTIDNVKLFGGELIFVTGIMFFIIIILLILNIIVGREKTEIYETWACGFNRGKPFMQYNGTGYSQPIARFGGSIADYKKEVIVKETVFMKQKTSDIIEKAIYAKVLKVVEYLSNKVIKVHYGKIQLYISYIFISLIIALVLVVKFV